MPSNCTLQQGGRHQTTIYHPEKYDSSVHSILIDGVPFPTVVQDFPGAEWAGGRESKEDLGSGTIWIDSEEDLGSGTIWIDSEEDLGSGTIRIDSEEDLGSGTVQM